MLAAMIFRLLMCFFGPFSFVLDLLWMGADTEHQTLRDCYAGNYVVRANVQHAGMGLFVGPTILVPGWYCPTRA